MTSVGISLDLNEGEQLLIRGQRSIVLKQSIWTKTEDYIFKSVAADQYKFKRIFAIPYLTNKRIVLCNIAVSKRHELVTKWVELPLEYIKDVKAQEGSLHIIYAVPQLHRSFLRRLFALSEGKDTVQIALKMEDAYMWDMAIAKLIRSERGNDGFESKDFATALRFQNICKNCGKENYMTREFCINCGHNIGKLKCYDCGKGIPANSKFCPHCGSTVDLNKEPQSERRIKPESAQEKYAESPREERTSGPVEKILPDLPEVITL